MTKVKVGFFNKDFERVFQDNTPAKAALLILASIVAVALVYFCYFAVFALGMMAVWNYLIVPWLHVPVMTFWVSVGLWLVINLVIGLFRRN